jgi:hypothetical protein
MDAEPKICARALGPQVRSGATQRLGQTRRRVGLLWILAAGVCLPITGMAEAPRRSAIATEPSSRFVAGTVVPQHTGPVTKSVVASAAVYAWQDGATRRTLAIVPELEADFSPRVERRDVLQPAGSASAQTPALISPVFRDDSGALRALPGGVIVSMHAPLDDAAVQRLFDQAGVVPARKLTETLWLLQAPTGLPALQLANRLHDSGLFASAQPNWWAPRIRK